MANHDLIFTVVSTGLEKSFPDFGIRLSQCITDTDVILMFGQHPYEKPNAVGCADRVNWIQSGCNNISKFKNIRIARRDHF